MKTKKNFLKKLAAVTLGFVMTLGVGAAGYAASASGAEAAGAGTDVLFAKGFAGNTNNSFSASGTDYSAVANSTNISGVTYALRVFNGSTGAVRGNQGTASNNFSARNTSTQTGYYISSVSLTVSGGTLDGSTSGRSVVYFKSTAIDPGNISGTQVVASPKSSGQATLTWTNNDTTCGYFCLYNLKTSGTALSAAAGTALQVTWSKASTKLDKPTSLEAVQASDSTDVTLSWGIVTGAVSYKVVVDNSSAYTYTGITGTSKVVTGLTAGDHSFTVQAIASSSDSNSDVSDPYDFSITQIITDWAFKELQFAAGTGQTTYTQDAEFNKTGYSVTLVEHSNTAGEDRSTPISAEDWTASGFDSSEVGTCDVYAQYSYKGVVKTSGNSVTCTITEKPLEATYIFDSGTFAKEFATWGTSYSDHGPYEGIDDCDGDYDATITFHKASKQSSSTMPTFATKTASGSWYKVLDFSFTDTKYYISTIEINYVQYSTKTPDVALFNGNSATGTPLDSGTLGTKNTLTASNLNTTTFCLGYCDKSSSNVQGQLKNIKVGLVKKAVDYNYTFDNNGGSGIMTGGTQQTSSFTLPQCTFTAPENYVFNAWALNSKTADPKAPGDEIELEEGDNTIYALWRLDKTLTSVTISGILTKTSYSTLDSWSRAGLTATANYSDETHEDVTDSAIWAFSPEAPSYGVESVTITATYGEKSDSETYTVSVNKAKLATPEPSYSNKKIVWDDVEHAVSYKGRVGTTGDFVDVTSPYDVSQYSGDGQFTFYLKAVGDDIYADSDVTSVNFEVPAIVYYQLVTSTSDLVAGSNYIFGNVTSGSGKFMSTEVNANNRRSTSEFTVSNDGKVDFDTTMMKVVLGGSEGAWTFKTLNYGNSTEEKDNGYLQAKNTTSGTDNHLLVGNYATGYADFDVSFKDNGVLIAEANTGARRFIRYNGGIYSCYTANDSQADAYLFKEVSTAKTVAISVDSLDGFVDADDSTVKVTCGNFTPTGITFAYADGGTKTSEHEASSDIASVSAALSGSIYTLTVDFKAPGSTNVKIDVSGANNLPSLYLDINAFAVPDSVKVGGGTGISEQEIQYVSEGTQKYVGPGVTVYDASGNAISGAEWKREILEGSDNCVALSGDTRVTAIGEGDATVRYTAVVNGTEFNDVYKDVIFHCIKDYIETVTDIEFEDVIVATQGDVIGNHIDLDDIFKSATGTTHFGTTNQDIDYSEFSFSYNENREGAVKEFTFDATITEDTEETVYVFHDVDTKFKESFTAYVEAAEILVTGIEFNNEEFIEEDEGLYSAEIVRNSEIELDASVIPDNTTEVKTISFSMSQDEGGDASLNGNILNVGSVVGNKIEITATADANPEVVALVYITVTRESQTVHIVESESVTWTKITDPSTLKAGDVVILTGVKADKTYAAGTYNSGNNVPAITDALTVTDSQVTAGVTDEMIYTLEAGTVSGSVAFKDSAGKYLYAAASGSNNMKSQDSIDKNASFTLNSNGTVIATESSNRNYMRYNNSSTSNLFSCYASTSEVGTLVTFYKRSGGTVEDDLAVSDSLFNAVVSANNIIESGEMTSAKWTQIAGLLSSFTSSSDEERILKSGVSVASGNEVEQFLFNYDILVAQGYNNFLHRADVQTYTITIDYDYDGKKDYITYSAGEYKLPTAERKGYELSCWEVNGEQKLPGSTITISGDTTIKAVWLKAMSFTNDIGFKFTGLKMEKFQLVFNGSAPEGAVSYGFLYTTTADFDLKSVDIDAVKNGEVSGVNYKENTERLSLNTSYGDKEVTVIFYWYDSNSVLHYSDQITMSFNEYVTSDSFDINSITDQYARLCLQVYLASLEKE